MKPGTRYICDLVGAVRGRSYYYSTALYQEISRICCRVSLRVRSDAKRVMFPWYTAVLFHMAILLDQPPTSNGNQYSALGAFQARTHPLSSDALLATRRGAAARRMVLRQMSFSRRTSSIGPNSRRLPLRHRVARLRRYLHPLCVHGRRALCSAAADLALYEAIA